MSRAICIEEAAVALRDHHLKKCWDHGATDKAECNLIYNLDLALKMKSPQVLREVEDDWVYEETKCAKCGLRNGPLWGFAGNCNCYGR